MTRFTLTEHVTDWHAETRVDREGRTVRNVALTGMTSKNGYRYAETALQEATPLYDQRPVFLDHAADLSRPQERSTRDLVGTIVNPHYAAGRIRGDIKVLDTESGRTFLALAESDAPGVGMSHVVLAERTTPDGEVVRIHDVVSVDAVVFPATTTTFRESQSSLDSSSSVSTSTAHVREDQADAVNASETAVALEAAATLNSSEDGSSDTRVQQLLTERDELRSALLAERARRAELMQSLSVGEWLRESGLPEFAITDVFRRQLAAADDHLRRDLLEDRRRLIEAARRQLPVSLERRSSISQVGADTVFISAIKRRLA